MPSVARFVSLTDGFEAKIDEDTGEWIVTLAGPNPDPNLVAFNKSLLEVRAPADADYTPERMKNWWGEYASVETPRHWFRMLRAKDYFPDGEVVVEYEPSGDEGKNLIY